MTLVVINNYIKCVLFVDLLTMKYYDNFFLKKKSLNLEFLTLKNFRLYGNCMVKPKWLKAVKSMVLS